MKPEKPEEPKPGDCCGQGCRMCVWDMYVAPSHLPLSNVNPLSYEEKLDEYNEALHLWQNRHPMPESDSNVSNSTRPDPILPLWRYIPIANGLCSIFLKHLQ